MWRFASAVAIGTGHARTGTACQDRAICRLLGSDGIVIAVSDGAGSATRAEAGAEIATAVFCESIESRVTADDFDPRSAIFHAAEDAIAAIRDRSQDERVSARDYAATLLAFVQKADAAAAIQIGDGVICFCDDNENWSWFDWPQRGEYASSTYFLTDDGALEQARIETLRRPASDIIIMSDGLEPLALNYASKTVHQEFARPLIRPLRASGVYGEDHQLSASLARFIGHDRITSRTDDDLSIVMASRFKAPG